MFSQTYTSGGQAYKNLPPPSSSKQTSTITGDMYIVYQFRGTPQVSLLEQWVVSSERLEHHPLPFLQSLPQLTWKGGTMRRMIGEHPRQQAWMVTQSNKAKKMGSNCAANWAMLMARG